MFLKRRASKLMGLEATKHLLTMDLEDLSLSMGNIPASIGFVEGCWFLISLEKRSRSATSSKKELKLDHSGINPMSQSKQNAQMPVVIPMRDRLQMVVTLYRESKKSHSTFQPKLVTVKLKLVKADSTVGFDVLVPIASHSLNISELVSTPNLEGRDITLSFQNMPQTTLRAQVSLTPIEESALGASSHDIDDAASVSSREDSDVGFDYDDLVEPATKVNEAAGAERRRTIARRSSYLAEEAVAPPTLQRKRSLVVQRAKSHLSSLFAQIKEDDHDDVEHVDFDSSRQDLVEEVTRLSLSLSSPGMLGSSPLFSQRGRAESRATPSQPSSSRSKRIPSSEAAQPSPFLLKEHGHYMKELLGSRSWVCVMFRLARQQVSEQRTLVASLTEELDALRAHHATQLEALQREAHDAQAELSVARDRLAVLEEREHIARLPPLAPLSQDSSAQTMEEEGVEVVSVACMPRCDQAVQTEEAASRQSKDEAVPIARLSSMQPTRSISLEEEVCGPTEDDDHHDDEEEEEEEEDAAPAQHRQSFLVSPQNRASLAIEHEARASASMPASLLAELSQARDYISLLEQTQAETRVALREAANKIVEACIHRAELDWDLHEALADLAAVQNENRALREDIAQQRKKRVVAAQQVQQYREQYTKLEVKYRTSMAHTSPVHAVRKQVSPS